MELWKGLFVFNVEFIPVKYGTFRINVEPNRQVKALSILANRQTKKLYLQKFRKPATFQMNFRE
jgi:hypothetical protein